MPSDETILLFLSKLFHSLAFLPGPAVTSVLVTDVIIFSCDRLYFISFSLEINLCYLRFLVFNLGMNTRTVRLRKPDKRMSEARINLIWLVFAVQRLLLNN